MIYEFESPKEYFEKNNSKMNYDNLSKYAKDTWEVVYKEYKRRELLRAAEATADKLDGVMPSVAFLLRELSKEL